MVLNEYYTLSNGVKIPKLGLGTWFIEDSKAPDAVNQAVQIGYRHIDTAQAYSVFPVFSGKQKGESDMKVLAVSASPRKGGNSDVLCDQLLKGAVESGNEVEEINLSGLKIGPCAACYGTRTWYKGDVYRHPSFEKAYEIGKTIGGK